LCPNPAILRAISGCYLKINPPPFSFKGFHELRAAYACERYEQITQHRAPINGGQCYLVDRNLDRDARRQISYELGHGRIDVIGAYIGGRA